MAAKIKITKRLRSLVRGPGGRFVSDDVIKKIAKKKAANPKSTYKELSAEYFKRSKKQAAKYSERIKDESGQFISKAAANEIKTAAKNLGIPEKQARALFLENKLLRVEMGNIPLHSIADMAESYSQRKDVIIRIKLPGDKRFRVYKNIDRAQMTIEKYKKKIFKEIRKRTGKKKIESDEIPVLPVIEKVRPGEFLPSELIYDFSKTIQLNQLDDDEYEEVIENLKSGAYNYKDSESNEKPAKRNRKK